MWKNNEPESAQPASPPSSSSQRALARLGPSIKVKGKLSGQEDLLIEGRVDGEVSLEKNDVTIGPNGKVKADVHGASIHVEGEVNGNLIGRDQVIIRKSGKVRGNVTAPRVNLENGAKFKGAIDMQPAGTSGTSGTSGDAAPGAQPDIRGARKPPAAKGESSPSAVPSAGSTVAAKGTT